MLAGLDVSRLKGLEIGALDSPIVTSHDGDVIYVDHMDREALRSKYARDENVQTDRLVDVNIVWGEHRLAETLGARKIEYVVASHVVEHVPDLVGWLVEISEILSDHGQLRLVIPDRRFTFDFFRRESRMSDVLSAFIAQSRAPTPIQIIDHFSDKANFTAQEAWDVFPKERERVHTIDDAGGFELAKRVAAEGGYHDVHCWVFTPTSFAEILLRTARLGLHPFSCRFIETTRRGELEFYCALELQEDREIAIESWSAIYEKLKDTSATPPPERSAASDYSTRDRDITMSSLEMERDLALTRLSTIEQSRSWRLVTRLRKLRSSLKSVLQAR